MWNRGSCREVQVWVRTSPNHTLRPANHSSECQGQESTTGARQAGICVHSDGSRHRHAKLSLSQWFHSSLVIINTDFFRPQHHTPTPPPCSPSLVPMLGATSSLCGAVSVSSSRTPGLTGGRVTHARTKCSPPRGAGGVEGEVSAMCWQRAASEPNIRL